MANIYLYSGAGGAANGTSWANAYLTTTAALAGTTSADTVWRAHDHSESTAGAVTLTHPTTFGAKIYTVNRSGSVPPVAADLLLTSQVAVGASANLLTVANNVYDYGNIFLGGTNNSGNCAFQIGPTGTAGTCLIYEKAQWQLRTTNTSAATYIGSTAATTTNWPTRIELIDNTFKFAATAQYIAVRTGHTVIRGMLLDAAGSTPTTLFKPVANMIGTIVVEDSDLSALSWTNLVDISVSAPINFIFRRCKFPSGYALSTGTHAGGPGGVTVEIESCGSADSHIEYAYISNAGTIVEQTTTRILSSGGLSQADGTNFSLLLTGNANTSRFNPLYTPWYSTWNTATGSAMALTMESLRDNATPLTDAQIHIEARYFGTSGFPQGTYIADKPATTLTAGANQTSSAASWDTTSMSNPETRAESVSLTPQEAGAIRFRVVVTDNVTVYVAAPSTVLA